MSTPLSQQPISDPHSELQRGIIGSGYTMTKTGKLIPDATTRATAAKARALSDHPDARVALITALTVAAVLGAIFWSPFLEIHLETVLGGNYGWWGAAVSACILSVFTKLFTLIYATYHAHRSMRSQGWAIAALIAGISIFEAAAIASGMTGQSSAVLDPASAMLPYLAGGLLTALNLAAAWALGKIYAEQGVVQQASQELLALTEYQHGPLGVLEGRDRLRILHAAADRTQHLPGITAPAKSSNDTPLAPQPPAAPRVVNEATAVQSTIHGFSKQP